ncbi:hypothetical protein F5X96DRAFT_667955 [Biscogniauxia mediterranea]|nr:hypothetical protein F5X96DRAFT_667955 [Biscogniauxia mediterranea]
MVIEAPLAAIRRPRVALTLEKADIFILANKGEVEAASFAAGGVKLPIAEIASANGVQIMDEGPRASKPGIPPAQISKHKQGSVPSIRGDGPWARS